MQIPASVQPKRLLAHGVMRNGRRVLLHADGEVSDRQKRRAQRNHERWVAGKRPNALGIWKEVDLGGPDD